METYEPPIGAIVHETLVDFVVQPVPREVTLVQYDDTLPILKVNLYSNGEKFYLRDSDAVSLHIGKVDHTFAILGILGASEDRSEVYFSISKEVTPIPSKILGVVELGRDGALAFSSAIPFIIEKNPIQNDWAESQIDITGLQELVEQASEAAAAAQVEILDLTII